jgi:PDDEXK-like domain of unknown function (DUF3799)
MAATAVQTGIHDGIDSAVYHADRFGDQPSLSASIAKLLCDRSPLHAWTAHPRLNPDYEDTHERKFDIGTCAHSLLLEGGEDVEILDFDNYLTKAAKEARDEARAFGRTPVLRREWDEVQRMCDTARRQLARFNVHPPLLTDGKPEQTLVWQDVRGVICRARVDWLRDDLAAIDDLKTTSASANPESWPRRMLDMGGDIQTAFYMRGVRALTGLTPEWRFIVAETYPPYAVSVVAPGPASLTLAERKVEWAINKWADCLAADRWPSYPTQVCYADSPPWEEQRWMDREERDS